MKKINSKNQKYCGFTLIEALIAAMLIGLVVAAIAAASGAFTMANGYGLNLSTAEFLVEQAREMTATLPVIDPQTQKATFGPETGEAIATYDDLDDFNNAAYNPPRDISRAAMTEFAGFTQRFTVQNVSAPNFTTTVSNHSSDFVRVTVTILKNNVPLASTSWIRANY